MIVERIRRVDSFGLYVNMWIIGLVGFPMAVPYYVPRGSASTGSVSRWSCSWAPCSSCCPSSSCGTTRGSSRSRCWPRSPRPRSALSTSSTRRTSSNIVTGQGYFVKTLVYSTVAEAQAPSIDALIVGYGVGIFFLAFVGLALLV